MQRIARVAVLPLLLGALAARADEVRDGASVLALTDAELDAIAAKNEWSCEESAEKTSAAVRVRGPVPRPAARATFEALLRKNGLAGRIAASEGLDWWCPELEAGIVYQLDGPAPTARDRVIALGRETWSAATPLGRGLDVAAPRRAALRRVEAGAADLLRRLAVEVPRARTVAGVAETAAAIASVAAAAARLDTARAALRDEAALQLARPEGDPTALGRRRDAAEGATRELAARREALRKAVTPREELRLVARGVID